MLPPLTALNCLARTFCINAAATTRGMQQIGLAFVLTPAFFHLYPDVEARARAFARHGGHSNTHVFMVPLYVGIILSLEKQIAQGILSESSLETIRSTLGTTLSALGDSFFSGTLLPLWALSSMCLVMFGLAKLALLMTLLLWIALLTVRVTSFFLALRHGITILLQLKRLDLINWAGRLKAINMILTILLLGQIIIADNVPWQICAIVLPTLLGAVWLIGRLHLSRILLWTVLLGILFIMDEELLSMYGHLIHSPHP